MKHLKVAMLIIAILAPHAKAQLTTNVFFFDDFNRANSTSLGSATNAVDQTSYEWIKGGAGGTINDRTAIVSSNLVISNTGTSGRDWAYVTLTNTSGFSTIYSNSTAQSLDWYVNMRQIRTDPSGFNSGNYGTAFVIGASSANFTNAGVSGYALLYGETGTTDPLRFAFFTNGLVLNSGIQNVITATNTGADLGNEYLSIRLSLDVASGTWSLSGSTNSSFVDPFGASLSSYGTASNTTLFGTDLAYMGGFWNYGAAAGQTAQFDNIRVVEVIPEPSTYALLALAGAGLAGYVMRRRRRS